MSLNNIFNEFVTHIKTPQNYVPRNYQTIGGMWTVDTWQKDDYRVQVMDEGYTTKIMKLDADKVLWSALQTFNGKEALTLEGISESEFSALTPAPQNAKPKKIAP